MEKSTEYRMDTDPNSYMRKKVNQMKELIPYVHKFEEAKFIVQSKEAEYEESMSFLQDILEDLDRLKIKENYILSEQKNSYI